MALGDPINIDVTVSGENNTIVSFQGGDTNVTQYSGGNSIESTLSENTSSVSVESGYNVDVNFTGASTSVQNAAYVIGSSATPFSCADLDGCNLFESGHISGLGTILVSGSGNNLLVSGASSSASIEIKNEGASLTSAVSSIDFVGDGINATNSGPAVTITVNTGSLYPANNPSGFITGLETGHLVGKGESGLFYPNSNPSGFITGLDTGNFITETGHLVGKGESGLFYPNSNPSGFITGVNSGHLITGASNLGTGSGLYSGTIANDLKFKTLIAGPNIVLSGDNEHIMISGAAGGGGGGGTTQTAANIGFGSGIYSGTVSDEFKLRSISGAGSVTITGHEDNTIIVSGSEVAGGAVSWTLPPPLCPTGIGTTGQISFDDVYYYICIRENTWRRVAISEWSC